MSMEQKYIKADLESSNKNWTTLYGQINKKCRDQETLNRNGEYEIVGITQNIKNTKQLIAKYNEENG